MTQNSNTYKWRGRAAGIIWLDAPAVHNKMLTRKAIAHRSAFVVGSHHITCSVASIPRPLNRQLVAVRNSSSSTPTARLAVASGAVIALAALAPATYHLLSSVTLPPLDTVLEVAGCCTVGAAGITKLVLGDKFHIELHKGRLYLQFGVPSSGPSIAAGSITTKPTGDARGNGAFATQLIPQGTHIADYSGDLLDREAFFARYPDGVGDYAMAIDQDYVIDAADRVGCTSTFHPVHMNHSRQRFNVLRYYNRSAGRVAFFAARDIMPGEELLFDYGRAYWRGRENLELP